MVRKTIISALIGAGVLFAAPAAHAVGMGKLTVLSGLGQPFRGEIELLAVERSEEGSLAARLAPPEIFQQAKIERAGALLSLRFDVAQKQSGQWFIKLSSQNPVNEPFLDILVEVNWPSGKLLREYTILLDPPGLTAEQPPAPPVEIAAVAAPASRGDEVKAVQPGELRPVKEKKPPKADPQPAAQGEYGPVKSGDTLRKIASAVKPEGVNTEQMLVALFRANQQAFSGNNMNRLKTGQILRIPDTAESASLTQGEIRKEIRAHTADWNAYRQKLAGMVESTRPAHEDEARQAASGKITTAVEDKPGTPEAGKDVLKLSRSESTGGKPGKNAAQDDAIAHEKALRDANQRIAELEKNIKDMQRLLEINSSTLSEKPTGKPAEATPPAQPAKPAEAEKPAEAAAPVSSVESTPPVVEAVEKEAPKPKPKVVSLQPKAEDAPAPSILDELLGNPLALAGGALVALLGGLFGARALAARRKSGGKSGRGTSTNLRTEPDTAELAAVAANFSAGLTDFTQTGMGSIDTADVDPIAEAEVYMAYGRDVQAEEILREAMVHDPQRHEIHLKLLEIYAARKDKGSFEAMARQLYVTTGGTPDPDWEKAASMGRELDSDNPLYGDGSPIVSGVAAPEVGAEGAPFAEMLFGEQQEAVDASPDLDFNLDAANRDTDGAMDMPLEETSAEEQIEELAADLDFNLEAEAPAQDAAQAAPEPAADAAGGALDFNLEMPAFQPEEPDNEAAAEENLIDFNLDTPPPEPQEAESAGETLQEPEPAPAEAGLDGHMLNFDLEMPTGIVERSAAEEPLEAMPPEEAAADEAADFPLDIDFPLEDAAPPLAPEPVAEEVEAQPTADFSETMLLDLSALEPEAPPAEVEAVPTSAPELPEAVAVEEEHESILIPPPAMSDEAMLDFDFTMGEDTPDEEGEAPQAAAANIDLSDISLDLDETAGKTEATPAADDGARFLETATKLDLAKAYMEMGDKEGAREILQEVLQEGSDEQQGEAGKLLAQLD